METPEGNAQFKGLMSFETQCPRAVSPPGSSPGCTHPEQRWSLSSRFLERVLTHRGVTFKRECVETRLLQPGASHQGLGVEFPGMLAPG